MTAEHVIESFLERAEIPARRTGPSTWGAQITGERKHAIGFGIELVGDRVRFECFFMRRPMQNEQRFYELLLRRNMRAYGVHFAIDGDGDVYLVGQRGVDGLTEDELDRIVGAILVEADGMFTPAIEIGFSSYLEADLAWRARSSE